MNTVFGLHPAAPSHFLAPVKVCDPRGPDTSLPSHHPSALPHSLLSVSPPQPHCSTPAPSFLRPLVANISRTVLKRPHPLSLHSAAAGRGGPVGETASFSLPVSGVGEGCCCRGPLVLCCRGRQHAFCDSGTSSCCLDLTSPRAGHTV